MCYMKTSENLLAKEGHSCVHEDAKLEDWPLPSIPAASVIFK